MLILDACIGFDISYFLEQLSQDSISMPILSYDQWVTHQSEHPLCSSKHLAQGIIYVQVKPEIAYNWIIKQRFSIESSMSLDYIEKIYKEKEELLIQKKGIAPELEPLPLLILQGNIDFKTDLSQYYNHLFYIKRFIKDLEDKQAMMNGTYVPKSHHRHCC